jgi:hypothetical protein
MAAQRQSRPAYLVIPLPLKSNKEIPMSFLGAVGKDIGGVFKWLASPKGQVVVQTAGAVAVACGAPAILVTLAESWITKAITIEAIAVAAGQSAGNGEQKAAAVLKEMGPLVAAYFPNASQEKLTNANNAIVAFLNALSADDTPVAAGK